MNGQRNSWREKERERKREREREREKKGSENTYASMSHAHFYATGYVYKICCGTCHFHKFYSVHIPIPNYLYCVNTIYRSS